MTYGKKSYVTHRPDRQQCHYEGSSDWQADTTASTLDSSTLQQLKSVANIRRQYRWPASSTFAVALCNTDDASARRRSVVSSHRRHVPAAVSGNCSTATSENAATRNDIELTQSVSRVSYSVGRHQTGPTESLPHTLHAHNRRLAHLAVLPTTELL